MSPVRLLESGGRSEGSGRKVTVVMRERTGGIEEGEGEEEEQDGEDYLSSSDFARAKFYVRAAESQLGKATAYEKEVFKAVNYLISENMDEDVALELHSKNFPKIWEQLCHVLQTECRFKEAVEFMEECSASWDSCSSLRYSHNWWHVLSSESSSASSLL
ncbi:uncharacterized protein LOC18030898 [Eutrema salsugineum]|uniref:uncharacterized protein LOC18030898 n=1 Tax=Eutrema salsugineum TaxID=72664 RepID=UPI000CECECF4|nr:uncharacterized protein LOC18030898 [Eutrema salsugineum]